ncbi:prefoldin subunit 2 [Anaeramoeba ignava]|uniref:Prefoldin subunit 2 n=1 Tax=Anaeramoeba ignava TaxID=1746090 RepID=A0A9Q0L6B2_ANAIG|nr:prefoldin subunit 2 [Anaeramoeba ignava]KAJ5072662.1 prefoldin subunit 2 [Anaeramoeba ignava]
MQTQIQNAITTHFNQLVQEKDNLINLFNDTEIQKREHEVVVKALTPLDKARKCFRLIDDVLVEQTVGDVLPILEKELADMEKTKESLQKQLELKSKEVVEFQQKHHLNFGAMKNAQKKPTDEKPKENEKKKESGILI